MGFYHFARKEELLNRFDVPLPIEAFAFDKDANQLIVGSNQVYWIDPVSSNRVDSFSVSGNILAGAWINDIAILPDHTIWVAGDGGVERIDTKTKTSKVYSKIDGTLPCNGAVSLCEDVGGNLWAGGSCGLLYYNFNEAKFVTVLPDKSTTR